MRSKRSRATDISPKVRAVVIERDSGRCIFCGSHKYLTIAHYIPRSSGGLGIEQNLTLACFTCHYELDHGMHRKEYQEIQKDYLDKLYPNFKDMERKYSRWKT